MEERSDKSGEALTDCDEEIQSQQSNGIHVNVNGTSEYTSA